MIILVKSSLVLVFLLAFYKFLLEKESFFAANRWYLLSCLGLILMMPFIALPKIVEHQGFFDAFIKPATVEKLTLIDHENTLTERLSNSDSYVENSSNCQTDTNISSILLNDKSNNTMTCDTRTPVSNQAKDVMYWVFWIYIFGVVILSINLLAQITSILKMIVKNKDQIVDEGVVIINMKTETEPCSFFKYIFINPTSYDLDTYEQILNHEKIHANQWHSVDLLLSEMVGIMLWFNPFIWLLRKEIEKNIEYQTDDILVTNSKEEKKMYQLNLVKIACQTSPLAITTNYNQSLIKQRIMRMNSKKSNSFSYWKYVFSLPLLFVLLLSLNNPLYSIDENPNTLEKTISTKLPHEKDQKSNQYIEKSTPNITPTSSKIILADCEAFEKAVAAGDVQKVKEILKTLHPDCLETQLNQKNNTTEVQQLVEAKQEKIEQRIQEETSVTAKTITTTTTIQEDIGEEKSPCEKVQKAVDERDITTLKNLLLHEDISCINDPDGNLSDDIELVKILMKYDAPLRIDELGIVNISDINFIINVNDAEKHLCEDPNYMKLVDAIRAKDETTIRTILSTQNLTCPLSVDGVTNDFVYIKKLMQYNPDIINRNGEEITVGGLGIRIDLENKLKEMNEYEKRHYYNQHPPFIPPKDAEYSCLSLIEAILIGEDFLVKEILKTVEPNCYHRETHTQNTDGHSHSVTEVTTPLIAAIWKNNVSMAKAILEAGADVNYIEENSDAPLIIATKNGNFKMVQLLIENDVHLNHKDEHGETALYHAIRSNFKNISKYLKSKGAK